MIEEVEEEEEEEEEEQEKVETPTAPPRSKMSPGDERIQPRPLPAPPAPPRNMKKKSASIDSEEGRGSRNSDRSCGEVTATENFRTCAESLNTSKTLRGNSN